jgi:hypothetical protein
MRLQIGDLVEPTGTVTASLSGYGGRPIMSFEPGMIGIVRHIDAELGGAQVRFFHPATGCMEAARTTRVRKLGWPDDEGLPADDRDLNSEWWFCGSPNWRSALHLLKAAAELRPDYFMALHPATLRLPGLYACRIRSHPEEAPDCGIGGDPQDPRYQEAAQQIDALIQRATEVARRSGPRQRAG